ncbi:MAG: long-chain fatty acid--CoA ligase, partial [Candidatus Competibacteraceae bacterium]|nr:long-chain fatty acid--CoA ligase [Candidatus Competibacteraceae bacterium]
MERTIPLLVRRIAAERPENPSQFSKDAAGTFLPTSYAALYKELQVSAAGLVSLGVKRGDHVGLISDNRKEWLLADLGILALGAADVPRGCDATVPELAYILGFSECRLVFAESETQAKKILASKGQLPVLETLVVFDPVDATALGHAGSRDPPLCGAHEARRRLPSEESGRDRAGDRQGPGLGSRDDHLHLRHDGRAQGRHAQPQELPPPGRGSSPPPRADPADIWLCVLPVWHSFERIMQYIALGFGSALAYSKPIGKIMLADCQKIKPTWMASVPRIWESIKAGVERNVNSEGGIKAALFRFFVMVGAAHASYKQMIKGLKPEFRRRSRILDLLAVIPLVLLTRSRPWATSSSSARSRPG